MLRAIGFLFALRAKNAAFTSYSYSPEPENGLHGCALQPAIFLSRADNPPP